MLFQLRRDQDFRGKPLTRCTFVDGLRCVMKEDPSKEPVQYFYCDTSRGQRLVHGKTLQLLIQRGEFRWVELRRSKNA
jgi:hypothetical protein